MHLPTPLLFLLTSLSTTLALPLDPRQERCMLRHVTQERVGDGDPHQNFYHIQLTRDLTCEPTLSCNIGRTEAEGMSVGFSFNIAPDAALGWIDGGFSVEKSWEVGETQTCDGGPGDNVCLWQRVQHTAYTVRDKYTSPCGTVGYGKPYVIRSPNKEQRGSYCVRNHCQVKGYGYWESFDNAPVGGA
ncbi:Hypothetical protein D9617_1g083520 [Elsinoe fawcettii]|nr:Hypothetical protein D9617_1g083520 [Elsinoe fawcettii]